MAEKDRAFALKGETDALNENIGDLGDLNTTDKTSMVDAVNEVLGRLPNIYSTGTTAISSVTDAVSAISAKSTGDVIAIRFAASSALATALLGSGNNGYAGIILAYKASVNNSYYFAWSRDHCAIGNISLQNTSVSIQHTII